MKRTTSMMFLLAAIAASPVATAADFTSAGEMSACGCYARWSANSLTVGNKAFSRSYGANGDVLVTTSFGLAGDSDIVERRTANGTISVACEADRFSPASERGLVVRVRCGERETTLRLWSGVPGVLASAGEARPFAEPKVDTKLLSEFRRTNARNHKLISAASAVADVLRFNSRNMQATVMTAIDQTDVHSELLETRTYLMPSAELAADFQCSSLDCRDLVSNRGVVFLRLAPAPRERPAPMPDFVLSAGQNSLATLDTGYPLASLVYEGGEAGRIAALQAFQRAVRPYVPGRDGVFLSNTWGDGNRDSRINSAFLRKEIDAGAELGVEVIQIDDGWQRGRTLNSARKNGGTKVWNGYWATDPKFWAPDEERFPGGLKPLADAAMAKGLKFGLWFGPDSSDNAANWSKDADCLLDFYRTCGISYFKIDSLKLGTSLALKRNRAFFNKMLKKSNAEMVFDLDCTAEIRPGYFGLMDIGPLFVENRYARPDARQYHPHLTLRSLWSLAQVIDPVRLRIEVLNPAKGRENYAKDDHLAPGEWPADALFAVAMTASPLGWMELSDIPSEVMAAWKPLVATWKHERYRWHGGNIFPVGDKPDGVSWTGFLSRPQDGNGGYALLFRERNVSATFSLDLAPSGIAATDCEIIGGRGKASLEGTRLVVTVPKALDFVWVKMKDSGAFPPYASDSFVPNVKGRKTGFFHCEKIDGRWWAIDPLGRGFVVTGCDGITYNGPYCEALKKYPYRENVQRKYKDKEAWNAAMIARLKKWGFNMLGNCGDSELFRRGIAHAFSPGFGRAVCLDFDDDTLWIGPTLHLPSTVFPNVFHPKFREHCRNVAAKYCAPNRDDPWLFGYFLDNELCWNGWESPDYRGKASKSTHVHSTRNPMSGMFDTCMAKRADHTARQAVEAFLDREYGKGKRPKTIPIEVKVKFLELVAETYFSTVTAAIREQDPNHLILGARFDGLNIKRSKVRPEVWRAAGKYCDVLSFNCYPWADLDRGYVRRDMPNSAESVADLFAYHYDIAKKPLLITEWSFPALDAGLPCLFGAGQRMLNQSSRVRACELFAKSILSLPFMIGYDYFKMNDQCALGNSRAFPEDSNYGLVNVKDEPYKELTAMFTRLHAESGRWRFEPTPTRREIAEDTWLLAGGQRKTVMSHAAPGKRVAFSRSGDAYEVTNGAGMTWRGRIGGENLFDSVTLNGKEIGSLGGMLAWHNASGRKKTWLAASRVMSADWDESTSTMSLVIRGEDGNKAYDIEYGVTFPAGRSMALVEIRSLANVGSAPIEPYLVYFRQHAPFAEESPDSKKLRLNPVKAIYKGYQRVGWFAEDGRYWAAATVATSTMTFAYRIGRGKEHAHPDAGYTFGDDVVIAPGQKRSFNGTAHAVLFAGNDGVAGYLKEAKELESDAM